MHFNISGHTGHPPKCSCVGMQTETCPGSEDTSTWYFQPVAPKGHNPSQRKFGSKGPTRSLKDFRKRMLAEEYAYPLRNLGKSVSAGIYRWPTIFIDIIASHRPYLHRCVRKDKQLLLRSHWAKGYHRMDMQYFALTREILCWRHLSGVILSETQCKPSGI
jgi:hypothetical protein